MNKKFLHTPFFYFLLLIAFFSLTGQSIHAQKNKNNNHIFNVGLKLGLNALSTNHYKAYIGETELPNLSYKNQSGNNLNLFFRINLDRFFMQPEIEWSMYKQELHFSLPSEDSWLPATNLSIKARTTNVNVLVGYNIIKNGPFLINVVAGPSFQYNYNTNYTIDSPNSEFKDKSPSYNSYGIVGITINIAKVHFDVRYEMSLFNTDIHFNEISNSFDSIKNVLIQKDENILSFSCGLMF